MAKAFISVSNFAKRMAMLEQGHNVTACSVYEMEDGSYKPVMYKADSPAALPSVSDAEFIGTPTKKVVSVPAKKISDLYHGNLTTVVMALNTCKTTADVKQALAMNN